jgi:SsrA-binding protein
MVPLAMYFNDGLVKVELGLVKGKKTWDRRHDLAERDAEREIARALSRHLKGRRP